MPDPKDDEKDFNGWGGAEGAVEPEQEGSRYPVEVEPLADFPPEMDLSGTMHEAVQNAFEVKQEIEHGGAFGLFLEDARKTAIAAATQLLLIDPRSRTEIARLQAQAAVYLHALEFAQDVILKGDELGSELTETRSH